MGQVPEPGPPVAGTPGAQHAGAQHAGAPHAGAQHAGAGQGATFDPGLCGVDGPLGSLTFEQLLSALELVTGQLANGDLGIEAAADLYEQAEILHAAAQDRLAAVEARIARLRAQPGDQASNRRSN